MPYSDASQNIKPKKIWWLIGTLVLMVTILVQTPAVWLINTFAPNSSNLQHVSGNIWQGSAVVELPSPSVTRPAAPLLGTVSWQWRPIGLLLGKLSADVDISSGLTTLKGQVNRGFNHWQIDELRGKIEKQTLASMVDWQLPDAPIQVNGLTATLTQDAGFDDVAGQLTWAGGEMGYPSGGKMFTIMLPAMRADLSQETRKGSEVLHANLVDINDKRLGDFYLDNTGMLDVNLTQRLLENMPTYKGSAPADTAVVTVRQPLFKGKTDVTSDTNTTSRLSAPNTVGGK